MPSDPDLNKDGVFMDQKIGGKPLKKNKSLWLFEKRSPFRQKMIGFENSKLF